MRDQRFRLKCGYVTATRISFEAFNDWQVQFHNEDGKTRWLEPLPESMFLSVFEPDDTPGRPPVPDQPSAPEEESHR